MLKKLIVSNFAVVEKAEAEFAPGLNVLTGETGAGKSVLTGALGLVLGERADASVVRDGAREAEVEAEFEVGPEVGKRGGERLSVRRTVTREGRSRAWINDESVAVAELKELGRNLVDIHGPTANQRLMEEAFQRATLDDCGHIDAGAYAKAWAERSGLLAQLDALNGAGGEDELDMLRFQVGELGDAELREEDETIAERHAAAAHAEEIVANANAVTEALGGDRSAAEILIRLQPHFREMAKHLPAAAEWAAEAEELTVRMQELSRTVADAASKLDVGVEDLEELDRRLTLVNRLKRKYRVAEVPALMALLDDKRAKLEALEHREERIAELEAKLALADKAVRKAGAELSKRRQIAAERLAAAVTKELRDLGFRQAKFLVTLTPTEPEAYGMDRVVYMFGPNPGEAVRPLAAIASSGEVARVMLALKVALPHRPSRSSRPAQPSVLVFDEIDANIGGETAAAVGAKMQAVARTRQVIAITHLPQSAVYGERHLQVLKQVVGGRTCTAIRPVEGEERISEIARMLGGETITTVVRKHAKELLAVSR